MYCSQKWQNHRAWIFSVKNCVDKLRQDSSNYIPIFKKAQSQGPLYRKYQFFENLIVDNSGSLAKG